MPRPQGGQWKNQLQENVEMIGRSPHKFAALILFALSACAASPGAAPEAQGCSAGKVMAASEAGLNQIQLCIRAKAKVHSFVVELAETSLQQSRGLMFRTELADDRGMLFPFNSDRNASFWMKNTVIPLDIIFIRRDGIIQNIAETTVPYSLDQIRSTAPVAAVLELRGGLTAELGIVAGDKVAWK